MKRRDFIVVLGAVIFRSAARTQQPGRRIIGYLSIGSHDKTSNAWAAFLQGMIEAGCIDGQNVCFDIQVAAGQYDRLPAPAAVSPIAMFPSSLRLTWFPPIGKGSRVEQPAIVFETGIDPVKDGLVCQPSRRKAHGCVALRRRARSKTA